MKIEYTMKINAELKDLSKLKEMSFVVGDIIYIPVEGYEKPISFEVVHVTSNAVYFMSKDILALMPIQEVDNWLDDFQEKLPDDLIKILSPIEHVDSIKECAYNRLVSLPSAINMGKDISYCIGEDDIMFDKFKTEISRCKSYLNGEVDCYWTDTLDDISDNYIVLFGTVAYGILADNACGVCPVIKIKVE